MIFIGAEDDFYHLQMTQTSGLKKETQNKDLKLCCSQNFLSEGGNILLMRYLALTNFHGALQFQGVTIEGKLVICNYVQNFIYF